MVYPLLMTVIAQVVFPHQANGSLIERDGKMVGSELIGQQFDDPTVFLGTAVGNFAGLQRWRIDWKQFRSDESGPTRCRSQVEIETLRKAHPDQSGPIPVDLVTASGSGLDPHISPAAAEYQVARVAQARGLEPQRVRELVSQHTEGRQLGVLGEPRVNVLALNLALETETPTGD